MCISRASFFGPILAAAGAASLVLLLGGLMTDLGPWYQSLKVPGWKPPDWLFGPMWTVIFGLWAFAAYIAWQHAPTRSLREWMLVCLTLNGFLNVLWSALFFRLHHPDWALIEVVLLWLSILLLIFVLGRASRLAALLLVPYLAWVSIAGALNLSVVRLNYAVLTGEPLPG